MSTSPQTASRAAVLFNKVPEITLFFWIIKICATTVGETAADYLSFDLNLGLTVTTYLMTALLVVVLAVQFRTHRYIPTIYWLAVVMVSICGTLFTDSLVDNLGVSLYTTTAIFSVAMAATFIAWYRSERTLSIHTIVTRRREAFYWAAILFTFALGTAAGDLISEKLGWGYFLAGVVFASMIGLVAIAYFVFHVSEVFAFWAAYVLTRPLGASLGDYLTASRHASGLAIATSTTTTILVSMIMAMIAYLTITKRDQSGPIPVDRNGRPLEVGVEPAAA